MSHERMSERSIKLRVKAAYARLDNVRKTWVVGKEPRTEIKAAQAELQEILDSFEE